MNSLRAKLALAFSAVALLAVGGTTAAGLRIFSERAVQHAGDTFEEARGQLKKTLHLRYEAFHAVSDLSYVLPVMRQVTAEANDESDFGLGSEQDDVARLKTLHDNLVDADWGWAAKGAHGFFAVADHKGRLLYASENKKAHGGELRGLDAVGQAFDPAFSHVGAMVIDAADPALAGSGMVGPKTAPGLYVLFARATVLGGEPRAMFIQGWRAESLITDLGIADKAARLSLVAPNGSTYGELPALCLKTGRALAIGARVEMEVDGRRWLVQRVALEGLGGQPIADLVLGYDLDQRLSTLLEGVGLLRLVAIAMLAIALLLGFALASRMARPIRELSAAADRVAGGDLNVTVIAKGSDEIGHLGHAFNRMTEGLRERDQIKSTFKRHVAPEVVEYLLSNPEANRSGVRMRLTMLFSDLAGFTTFSEAREPEAVVALLNRYLGLVSDALVARGGTLDKYMGDGVMAFFGAPIPHPNDAMGATLAALDHLRALETINAELAGSGMPTLEVRVGLHRGDVIVGSIGGEQSQDYTVIGDAVNLAARLEPVNKVYGTAILCSEQVWDEVKGQIDGREIDAVRVKGRIEPVRVFEILGEAGWLDAHLDKKRCVQAYEMGLKLYRERRYDDALKAFDVALKADMDDGPANAMRARVASFDGADASSSGVFNLTSK